MLIRRAPRKFSYLPNWHFRAASSTICSRQLEIQAQPLQAAAKTESLKQQEQKQPSMVICRLEELYDTVLAEDLMVLSYDHTAVNSMTPFRRKIAQRNASLNAAHESRLKAYETNLTRSEAMDGKKTSTKRPAITFEPFVSPAAETFSAYKTQLDPSPGASTAAPTNFYERQPRIQSVSIRMDMHDAVTHDKRVLLNGLLALQLVSGQQGHIVKARDSDARVKIRKGMAVGVQVCMYQPPVFYNFMEKLVEIVMPKLRDFNGFSECTGGESPNSIHLKFDAEAWQSFPEIEFAYLRFPQLGSVGSLQPFEVQFETTATTMDQARLLLSGFRIPFSIKEAQPATQGHVRKSEDVIHDV